MKRFYRLLLLLSALWLACPTLQAQCPMCRMSAESDLKNGGQTTRGLNQGILYLLTVPYMMMATLGYIWWRSRKRMAEEEQEMELRALLEPYDISLSDGRRDENISTT